MEKRFRILILGGGTGGISVASRLVKRLPASDIAIMEPSESHYYQPLWTLVGGGAATRESTRRDEADLIPKGVLWLREEAASINPETQTVATKSGKSFGYDYLIVAVGLELWWGAIAGLPATIGKNGVCSNYSWDTVNYTWESLRKFSGGTAIFTFPNTPIKCGGAPQKIMYLAEDFMRRRRIREKSKVIFASAGAGIFAVKKYADALSRIIADRQIDTMFKYNLVAIDGPGKSATFEQVETKERRELKFDMIHVTPPMGSPAFLRSSPIVNAAGYVDVKKHTLQHSKWPNVFSLGDCSSLPTSKTGAAIRKQAPVLVENLLCVMDKKEPSGIYDGYTSCPLVTGYGKLILAEFDYDGNPQETFPFDQSKERRSMYLLKKFILPLLYWQGMMKGRA